MDNTIRVKVWLRIWQRPGYGPRKRLRLGQTSGQTRGFASARAPFSKNTAYIYAPELLKPLVLLI